jgi:hypothetical protein
VGSELGGQIVLGPHDGGGTSVTLQIPVATSRAAGA